MLLLMTLSFVSRFHIRKVTITAVRPLWVSAVSARRPGQGPAQQLRQLGDVDGDAPGLIAGEEVRRRATSRLILEIDVGERLTVGVGCDKMRLGLPVQAAFY
jgi:hypothetical protein